MVRCSNQYRMVTALLLTFFCVWAQAQTVSVNDAAGKAVSFFNSSVRQSGRRMATKQNVTLHHTARQGDETYFYIFNKAEGGWVIVGGDEVCHDIIAFSETGSFNYDKAPLNVRNWLNGYEAEISHAISATTVGAARKVVKENAVTASAGATIEPLIQTHWDQGAPYWNKCPSDKDGTCYTGCVATAMAQVMYYWKWPVTGTGSKSYYDSDGCKKTLSTTFSDHTYDWANMKLETDDYTTTAQKNAVAQLMYDCGVSVEMMYGSDGSGAYSEDIPSALKTYFSYSSTAKYVLKSSYSETSWVNLIYAELSAGRPVLYAGADGTGSNAGGHQFVCDGYEYKSNYSYFHFNWGWSGDEDGFFTLSTVGKSYKFKYYQDAVIGIQPNVPKLYTVTLADDESKIQPSVAGGSVTLPTRVLPGYSFVGWANNGGIDEPTTTKPTILPTTYTPTANVTLYPVFSYVKKGEAGSGSTVLLSEDFNTLKDGSNTDTSSQAGSEWTGNSNFAAKTKAYEADGMLKLGSSKSAGSITTKAISAAAGANITVQFEVKGWTNVENSLYVGVTGCTDQKITYSATMSDTPELKSVTFTTVSANPQVTISTSSKRAFFDNLVITSDSGTSDQTYYCSYLTMATAQMKITPAKWATFYAPDDVELEPAVYAYAVTPDGGSIQRQRVAFGDAATLAERTVPAHTPVLVYKDVTSTYTKDYDTYFSVTPSSVADNCLVGTLVDISRMDTESGDNTNYVLQLNTQGKPAWFSVVCDDVNEKYNSLSANRAYLSLPSSSSVKDIFGDVATAITDEIQETRNADRMSFNLQGQTVDGSYRGIIIQNGKKILRNW